MEKDMDIQAEKKTPGRKAKASEGEAPVPYPPEREPIPAPMPAPLPVPPEIDQLRRKDHLTQIVSGLIANPSTRLDATRVLAKESQEQREHVVMQAKLIMDTIDKALAE